MIFSVDTLENIDDEKIISYHKKRFYVKQYFRKNELKRILEQIGFKNINIYPIFKSNYSKKLFKKMIIDDSRVRKLFTPFYYFLIKIHESRCINEDKGL